MFVHNIFVQLYSRLFVLWAGSSWYQLPLGTSVMGNLQSIKKWNKGNLQNIYKYVKLGSV